MLSKNLFKFALVLFICAALFAGCEEDTETDTTDDTTTDDGTTDSSTSTGCGTTDTFNYSLDSAVAVSLTETLSSATNVGCDPAIFGAVDTEFSTFDVLMASGITDSTTADEVIVDVFIFLIFADDASGLINDTAGAWAIAYTEGFDSAAESFDVIYSTTSDGTSSLTIDSFGAVGEQVTGSFNATLLDFVDFTTTHTLTGSFDVTREADDFQ